MLEIQRHREYANNRMRSFFFMNILVVFGYIVNWVIVLSRDILARLLLGGRKIRPEIQNFFNNTESLLP